MKPLRAIIGCEKSGVLRRAFRALGHEAYSCDLLPADDGNTEHHLQGDLFTWLDESWDIAILHPVCTRLANSGVLRLYNDGKKANGFDPAKIQEMLDGVQFFSRCWHAPVARLCVENPIQHCYAMEQLEALGVPPYTQLIQPYQFNEPESKATCLWLRGLPPLQPVTTQVPDLFLAELPKPDCGHWNNQTASGQNKLSPSPERAALRARTYGGIASAMAAQWSEYILKATPAPYLRA